MSKPQLHALLFFCLMQLAGLWGWETNALIVIDSAWAVLTLMLTLVSGIGALVALAAVWEDMSDAD